jgi:hypothetical protein
MVVPIWGNPFRNKILFSVSISKPDAQFQNWVRNLNSQALGTIWHDAIFPKNVTGDNLGTPNPDSQVDPNTLPIVTWGEGE